MRAHSSRFCLHLGIFSGLVLGGVPAVLASPAGQPGLSQVRIRVRVAERVPSVVIRGFDIRVYEKQAKGPVLVGTADRTSEWEVHCQGNRVRILPRFTRQAKKPSELDLASPISFQTLGGFVTLGTTPYRDELRVHAMGSRCDLVNNVDLEKYLDGLVNSEFSSKWNAEAISAQVVAARTYAYYQMQEARKKHTYFDLDATTKDQVYNGSLKEDFHSSQVVQKTRGMILTTGTDQTPKVIKAFYHSTCGGRTELPEHVWGVSYAGLHKSVQCPYCVSSPRYQWTLDLSKKDIQAAILRGAEEGSPPSDWPAFWREVLTHGRLMDLRFSVKSQENRVPKVISVWSSGRELLELPILGSQFREWMGPARFRSTSFEVYPNSSENIWHFTGTGNGHGVGMCQWGAKVMGEKGRKMEDILKLYYPDATLRQVW